MILTTILQHNIHNYTIHTIFILHTKPIYIECKLICTKSTLVRALLHHCYFPQRSVHCTTSRTRVDKRRSLDCHRRTRDDGPSNPIMDKPTSPKHLQKYKTIRRPACNIGRWFPTNWACPSTNPPRHLSLWSPERQLACWKRSRPLL